VVMYEMFTGRVPFEADSYMGVLTKHMYMAPTPPSQIVGTEKLGALEDVTLRCLQKKPDNRYRSLRELVADLDRVLTITSEPRPLARKSLPAARSLLADELELPSREELSIGLSQAGLKPIPRWPLALVGGLFALGIMSALGLRELRRLDTPRVSVARAPELPRAEAPRIAAPSSSAVAPPALSVAPVLAGASAAPPKPPAKAPRRAAERSGPGASTKPPSPATRKNAPSLGGSEIVDPWAK